MNKSKFKIDEDNKKDHFLEFTPIRSSFYENARDDTFFIALNNLREIYNSKKYRENDHEKCDQFQLFKDYKKWLNN